MAKLEAECLKCGYKGNRELPDPDHEGWPNSIGKATDRCPRCSGQDVRELSRLSRMSTGAKPRRFNKGATMTPEEFAVKCGFAPEDDDAAKLAKVMTFVSTQQPEAPPVPMAAEPEHKEPDGDEPPVPMAATPPVDDAKAQVMSATVTAMAARLATLEAAEAARNAEIAKAKDAEIVAFADHAVANGYPKEARDHLLTFARANLDGARAAVAPLLKVTGAPPHVFARVSAAGSPINAPADNGTARSVSGSAQPKVHKSPFGLVVADDEALGTAIHEMAESKDPTVMARIDANLAPQERPLMFSRLMAAKRIVEAERPELVEETDRRRAGIA